MVGFPRGLVPCVVHSLFKEYHTCARSFSLLLPPLAFSLSRPARTRPKNRLKPPLMPPLRTLPTWLRTLLLRLRTLLATPWLPLRALLTLLATPQPALPVLPLPLLRTLLLLLRKPLSNSRKALRYRIGRGGFGFRALFFCAYGADGAQCGRCAACDGK